MGRAWLPTTTCMVAKQLPACCQQQLMQLCMVANNNMHGC